MNLDDYLPKASQPLNVSQYANGSCFVGELAVANANESGVFKVGEQYLSEYAGAIATRMLITKAAERAMEYLEKETTKKKEQAYFINPCRHWERAGKSFRAEGLYLTKLVVPLLLKQGYITTQGG